MVLVLIKKLMVDRKYYRINLWQTVKFTTFVLLKKFHTHVNP